MDGPGLRARSNSIASRQSVASAVSSRSAVSSQSVSLLRRLRGMPIFSDGTERLSAVATLHALLALYSSIIMWVGGWNLLTEGKRARHSLSGPGKDSSVYAVLPRSPWRAALMTVVGMLGMVAMDTFYCGAGMEGTMLPKRLHQQHRVLVARGWVSFVATFLFWVGTYDILDLFTASNTLGKNLGLVLVGIILLRITDTVHTMAYVYSNEEQARAPSWHSCKRHHLLHVFRALVAYGAQNALWLGSYNLLEVYLPGGIDRQIIYMLLGLLLMALSGTLVANSWIETDYMEAPEEHMETSSALFARSYMSLFGQVINNTGFWTLIDSYAFPASRTRDAIYFSVGVVLVWMNAVFLVNAGIVPDEDHSEGPAFSFFANLWYWAESGGLEPEGEEEEEEEEDEEETALADNGAPAPTSGSERGESDTEFLPSGEDNPHLSRHVAFLVDETQPAPEETHEPSSEPILPLRSIRRDSGPPHTHED